MQCIIVSLSEIPPTVVRDPICASPRSLVNDGGVSVIDDDPLWFGHPGWYQSNAQCAEKFAAGEIMERREQQWWCLPVCYTHCYPILAVQGLAVSVPIVWWALQLDMGSQPQATTVKNEGLPEPVYLWKQSITDCLSQGFKGKVDQVRTEQRQDRGSAVAEDDLGKYHPATPPSLQISHPSPPSLAWHDNRIPLQTTRIDYRIMNIRE